MENIKTFMDFTCPFSYIGFEILYKLKDEETELEYEWYPYILNENIPKEGMDVTSKVPKEICEKSFKRLKTLGEEYDIVYNNKGLSFNTKRVHRAALYARDNGKLYEFGRLVFKKIFTDKENIAEDEIINDIAKEVKLDVDEMNHLIDEGKYENEIKKAKSSVEEYDVSSTPTFIVDEDEKVTFLKSYREFKKDLKSAGK